MVNKSKGITVIELLVVLCVIAIIGFVVMISFQKMKPHTAAIPCQSRLKEIGAAFRMYALDNNMVFPMRISYTNGGSYEYASDQYSCYQHFKTISEYLSTSARLICPKDVRVASTKWQGVSNINISYYIGIDAKPNTPGSILSGDRNIATNTNSIMIPVNNKVEWQASVGMHGNAGNVLYADAHVEMIGSAKITNTFYNTINKTNRYILP